MDKVAIVILIIFSVAGCDHQYQQGKCIEEKTEKVLVLIGGNQYWLDQTKCTEREGSKYE